MLFSENDLLLKIYFREQQNKKRTGIYGNSGKAFSENTKTDVVIF
jgi:hypothetical protein